MSWVFGFIGRREGAPHGRALRALHPSALHCIDEPRLYLAAGGLPETCLAGSSTSNGGRNERGREPSIDWVVLGVGLDPSRTSVLRMTRDDWSKHISSTALRSDNESETEDARRRLAGHFVVVHRTPDGVSFQVDPLGLRTLYTAERHDGLYFSTRLDWLAQAVGGLEIDFAAFGSHWIADNQFSYRPLTYGVRRMGPGERLRIETGSVEADTAAFDIEMPRRAGEGNLSDLVDTIVPFLAPELSDEERLSLGLSGGLDSRVLLALLIHRGAPFDVHVLGDRSHPDARIALRMAKEEALSAHLLLPDLEDSDRLLSQLREHAAATNATAPASASAKLSMFADLQADGRIGIDGFFGEILRGQYFQRLQRRLGRRDDLTGEDLLPHVLRHRAALFDRDAEHIMRQGLIDDLERVAQRHRLHGGHDIGTLADELAIRFRLPNFAGYEQGRLDGIAVTYMPFAQVPVLRSILRLPFGVRQRGRLPKRLIARFQPSLARYPLVKGTNTYPYVLPALPARLWTRVKKTFGRGHEDRLRTRFLDALSDVALDTATATEMQSYGPYDADAIRTKVEAYYAGDRSHAEFVDWWLAFEMWRQTLAGKR